MKTNSARTTNTSAALQQVKEVYADLARRPVERSCVRLGECCQFNLTGRTPFLTQGEALLALQAYRATGRKAPGQPDHRTCAFYDTAKRGCLIYHDRPFGCRTHFCGAAGGPYARLEVADLVQRLEEIDRTLGGSGGQKMDVALRDAMTL